MAVCGLCDQIEFSAAVRYITCRQRPLIHHYIVTGQFRMRTLSIQAGSNVVNGVLTAPLIMTDLNFC